MRDLPTAPMPTEAATALTRHVRSDNEILRSAAIKALIGLGTDQGLSLQFLTEARLDPDPDVRSDAMDALSQLALPEHAPLLRHSLEADPVREVKRAAIEGLARLCDPNAIELLRALTLSRCEDRVDWEDQNSDWEDWLDIQIAAIDALGEMKVTGAIDDMLAARDDELGQTLDTPVFGALSRMGGIGATWLLAILETEGGPGRRRALDTLCKLGSDALGDHMDALLGSPDAGLRAVAATLLPAGAPQLSRLVQSDPAASVRIAGLRHGAQAQPDLAIAALQDDDPSVQAEALDCLPETLDPALLTCVVDNLLAWIDQGPPALIKASAHHLPRRAPDRALTPLMTLVRDTRRPLDARITATHGLATMEPAVGTAELADLLNNPAQQVRTAVLVVLRERAKAGDDAALCAITAAITATLFSEEDTDRHGSYQNDGPDMTMPKEDEGAPRRIRISEDGEIIEDAEQPPKTNASTLAAILTPAAPANNTDDTAEAEDTPEEAPAKRRKRRAVEGPEAVIDALAQEAAHTCGGTGLPAIEQALLTRLENAEDTWRRIVWPALARHARQTAPADKALQAAAPAFADDDPVVRLAAFHVAAHGGLSEAMLTQAAQDPDALIRAEAVRALPFAVALHHLADAALPVRHAAVDMILSHGDDEILREMADGLARAERADTLAYLLAQSEAARLWILDALARPDLTDRAAFILLDAAGRLGSQKLAQEQSDEPRSA